MSDKKRSPQSIDSERFIINAVEEQELQLVCDGQSDSSEVLTAEDKESWSVDDSQPSQSSIDSNSTTSSYNTGEKIVFSSWCWTSIKSTYLNINDTWGYFLLSGSTETECTCSICEDQTGSEDGSPGRELLDTPPSGFVYWIFNLYL